MTLTSATVNFMVQNTGNTPYSAAVSVANAAQLEQLGWTVTLLQNQGRRIDGSPRRRIGRSPRHGRLARDSPASEP